MGRTPLDICTGILYLLTSTLTSVQATRIYLKIKDKKAFTFIKTELKLILAYEAAVFLQGCFWISRVNLIDSSSGDWLLLAIEIVLQATIACSLLLFLWNMAFMYYLSSRQLVAWVVAASSEEDPEILGRKFSVKFQNYSRIDFACRVFIVLLTLSFAVFNVLNRINGNSWFVVMTTEFGILVGFQVGVIWLLMYSFHSFKRCTRMIESMNSRVLNL